MRRTAEVDTSPPAPRSNRAAHPAARRRLALGGVIVLAVVFLYFCHLGNRSFWEPDEPRYAEIGREMLVTGDWITPRLDFLKYYEKPPLTYWSAVVSFTVFGVNEWSARLGPAIFAMLFFAGTWVLGRALFGARAATAGTIALALSPLSWVTGRLLVTDMFLAAGVTWTVAGYVLAVERRRGGRSVVGPMIVCGLGAAIALLAKGPIGILLPAFGIVPHRLLAGRDVALGWRGWSTAGAVLAVVAAPWFILISLRDPSFARFFFWHEHVLRFLMPVAGHEGAPYYYVLVLLAGLFPASLFLPWAATRTWPGLRPRGPVQQGTLLLFSLAILTLLFFSISKSKLPGYILPATPAFALIVGRALVLGMEGRGFIAPGLRLTLAVASGAMLAGGAGAFWYARHPPDGLDLGPHLLVAGGLLAFVGLTFGSAVFLRTCSATVRGLSLAAAGLFLFLWSLQRPLELLDPLRSIKQSALFVSANARPSDMIASYSSVMHGLIFYTGRRTAIVGGAGELSFGANAESTEGWVFQDHDLPRITERQTVYLVVSKGLESRAIADAKGRLRRVHDGGRFTVLSNVSDGAGTTGEVLESLAGSAGDTRP